MRLSTHLSRMFTLNQENAAETPKDEFVVKLTDVCGL